MPVILTKTTNFTWNKGIDDQPEATATRRPGNTS